MSNQHRPTHRTRRAALALALALAAAGAGAQPAPAPARAPVVAVDRIVAVVNEEAITRSELQARMAFLERQMRTQGVALPPRDVFEKQVLERMITERAQLQFAAETGLRVDDVQLDRTLRRIAEENKLSTQQLRETVEKDGVTFTRFREDVRNEIILARLRERDVDNKLTVSDAEIDQYLATQDAQAGKSTEYNVSHILLRVQEQASPEQIQALRRRAEEALAQLQAGQPFAQVAAAFSDAPDALQGGSLGWRPAGRLPTVFVEVLGKMKPGDVSPVLRSPNGFHLLKLVDVRGADATAVITQTHARHILIKTSELVSENDARNRLVQLRERIENGASFADLARLHSEDGSAGNGGDLGWVSPGDTVPEFERAMDALKPGQLSEPVKSPFGWHLIQVEERRTQDVTKDRQRLVARQAIRARKGDEAFQEWLRQLRDRAYVELRLEEK
ncbi:MAG TPA: peptidylprolyl isomerase [Burkholderiales bacterium]|nr:peptidylprolyl isomerase [Burkholderiales bacterium]